MQRACRQHAAIDVQAGTAAVVIDTHLQVGRDHRDEEQLLVAGHAHTVDTEWRFSGSAQSQDHHIEPHTRSARTPRHAQACRTLTPLAAHQLPRQRGRSLWVSVE